MVETSFFNDKPRDALIAVKKLDNAYATSIAREIDTTYAHTVKIIESLESDGYLQREQSGRKKILSLTSKGEELTKKFIEIKNLIRGH